MIVLNEEKYAKDLLMGQLQEMPSVKKKIELLARYNYHVLQKSDEDSYLSIVRWLNKHQDLFCEQNYTNFISTSINRAKKRPFYSIESVNITKKEYDIIRALNNVRYEKILFVLLCMAKIQKISLKFENNLVSYTVSDLFKMARVSVPADDREYILHDFLVEGLIRLPAKNDSRCLFVNFVDNAENDILFRLNEQDCNELAYFYLNSIGKGNVFRCSKCGKFVKQSKKYGDICKGCQEKNDNNRFIWCIDCGEEVKVVEKDHRTCRCEECNKIRRQEMVRENVRRFRDKNDV